MITALIVAGGRGQRLGGPIPKQYRLLDHLPIIRHTIAAFQSHGAIDRVRVVIHPDDQDLYHQAAAGADLPPPLLGGATRQESVRRGLEGLESDPPDLVLIHDAVRPFIAGTTIGAVIAALHHTPGAIAGVPLADTLKRCRDGKITGTVERTDLWRAQTPQGFHYRPLLDAHRAAFRDNPDRQDFTDDAAIAEAAGLAVAMVPASDDNFKITTEDDLARAIFILQNR